MNIVNKLTLRHLKENKRRTLVTIIGVIISVAMLTAVATIGVSFLDLMKRQEIADNGEWHVLYKNVNEKQIEAIKKDDNSKKVVLSRDLGYAKLEGSENVYKPYFFIKEYNHHGFKQFPIELSSGRLPRSAGEVVISDAIAANANVEYKVGDILTLDIGERFADSGNGNALSQVDALQVDEDGNVLETLTHKTSRTFKIVGIIERPTWEPTWSPGYTIISYVDENSLASGDTVNASVVLNKVNRSLYSHAEELAAEIQLDKTSIGYNSELLRYHGLTNNDNLRATLYSLTAIIMAVIIIGSVSLIYNAFAISVSERSRHLGMLASIGATKQQKRNSVFFEGAVIGLISIPIGIFSGLAGIGITFYFINTYIHGALNVSEKLAVAVTPMSILVACVVSILTIFISTYIPAKRASKVSAIDAIRQSTDIKLTGKAVKTSKLVRKLFGIEAEFGLKNLKRNKRRYQATVFSLVISIVLFLAVSYFTDSLKKSLQLSQDGVSYDIQVSFRGDGIDHQIVDSITSLKNVTGSSIVREMSLSTWIEEEAISKELKELVEQDKSMLQDGKINHFINMTALDDESLEAYAKKIGIDKNQLFDSERIKGIVIDTNSYQDAYTGKFIESKAINTEVGKTLELLSWNDDDEEEFVDTMEIAALTDELPMGVNQVGGASLNVIVSEQSLEKLLANKDLRSYAYLYLNTTDPMKTQQQIEDLKESGLYIYNVYQRRQQQEQMIMLMSVFTYGFILLITAISIANIFNTISTSISLRKREFAMLKSVGMTPKGFNKMINYESVFYGMKSLLYGLPISILVMYLIHRSMMNTFSYQFELPWLSILYVIVAVFFIVGSAMLYSSTKVKKENIIDALKQESI